MVSAGIQGQLCWMVMWSQSGSRVSLVNPCRTLEEKESTEVIAPSGKAEPTFATVLVSFLTLSLHLQKIPLETESNEAWGSLQKGVVMRSWAINSKSSLMQEVHTGFILAWRPWNHYKRIIHSFCNYWGITWSRSWLLVIDGSFVLNHLSISSYVDSK